MKREFERYKTQSAKSSCSEAEDEEAARSRRQLEDLRARVRTLTAEAQAASQGHQRQLLEMKEVGWLLGTPGLVSEVFWSDYSRVLLDYLITKKILSPYRSRVSSVGRRRRPWMP